MSRRTASDDVAGPNEDAVCTRHDGLPGLQDETYKTIADVSAHPSNGVSRDYLDQTSNDSPELVRLENASLAQVGILLTCLYEARKVGVGIFPNLKKRLIFLPGGGVVAFHFQGAGEPQMRE